MVCTSLLEYQSYYSTITATGVVSRTFGSPLYGCLLVFCLPLMDTAWSAVLLVQMRSWLFIP